MKTIDEKLAVMRGWLEGKAIQYQTPGGAWITVDNPVWEWAGGVDYRIKPEPAPKRRVPLGPDDLPAVCWVRGPGLKSSYLVVEVGDKAFWLGVGLRYSWELAMVSHMEYSHDRKTWNPMWKEVE